MFAIWRKIAIQTFLRGIVGKRLIAEVECFWRYQTGRKNFCLGSNLVDKNWTSKLKLSSRAFAVAIIFQVYVRWKINVVNLRVWCVDQLNSVSKSFPSLSPRWSRSFFFLLANQRFSKFKRSFSAFFFTFFFKFLNHSYK